MIRALGEALRIACLMEEIERAVARYDHSYTEITEAAEWQAVRFGLPESVGARALEFSALFVWCGYSGRDERLVEDHWRVELYDQEQAEALARRRERLANMDPATTSSFSGLMKALYSQKRIEELSEQTSPLLAMLTKCET